EWYLQQNKWPPTPVGPPSARPLSFAMRLVGHSAGGHLVARMMCRDVLPDTVAGRLARVVSVSGVHELLPLVATAMNDILNLTAEEAAAESPARCTPLQGVPFTAWVGAQERPEFLRQARLIEEAWARAGVQVSAVYAPGHHHFSVIEGLARPDDPLTREVLL
uniref:alpha/beta hydrolase n=1 Tax=Roseovarius salis TaxID=3376063 RepID=UPI0037C69920